MDIQAYEIKDVAYLRKVVMRNAIYYESQISQGKPYILVFITKLIETSYQFKEQKSNEISLVVASENELEYV